MKKLRLLADINENRDSVQDEIVEEMVSDGRLQQSPGALMVFDNGKHIGWE